MACGTALCLVKPVLIVAALAGVGMGGFNLATTGCPLGTCHESVATLAASHGTHGLSGTCPMTGNEVSDSSTVLTSSENVTPACDGTGCSEEMKAECEATGTCPMALEHCQQGDGTACPMAGGDCHEAAPEAAPAGQVADGEQDAETDSSAG